LSEQSYIDTANINDGIQLSTGKYKHISTLKTQALKLNSSN